MDLLSLLLYSLAGGLFSLFGGLLLLWKPGVTHKIIHILISFGAGAFLAAAFLDIFPEALEISANYHGVLLSALVGFVIFFVLERLFMSIHSLGHHDHDHSSHTESLSYLVILGDGLHNFLDGILIALAYLANPVLVWPTTLAIAAHEIPQEIGDFSILMRLNWKRSHIIAVNIIQSLLTIPGVMLGLFAGQYLVAYLPYVLGGTAGIFIYIAASDLIPELHHLSGHKHFGKTVFPLIASIVLMYFFIYIVEH
jgi:zinc and cadmium transporter